MELKKMPYELSVCKVKELCPEILADVAYFHNIICNLSGLLL